METHVKVLGVLFIVIGGLWICGALVLMLALGAASGIVGVTADPQDAAIALPIIGLAGSALVVFLLALGVPNVVAGIGILKLRPWGRILGIVLSAIHIIHIPIGTVFGAYGLWVLLTKETEQIFAGTVAIQPRSV